MNKNPGHDLDGGNNGTGGFGKSSNSGQKQTVRGVGVVSGLSAQESFAGESNLNLAQDTKPGSANQVPQQTKHRLSTDRGDFTCY